MAASPPSPPLLVLPALILLLLCGFLPSPAASASSSPPPSPPQGSGGAATCPSAALTVGRGGAQDGQQDAATATPTPALRNTAVVFVKPHANTAKVREYVGSALREMVPGVEVSAEFDVAAEDVDRKEMIDRHYYSIASKATLLQPDRVGVPEGAFQEFFGEAWEDVLDDGRASNALDACREWKIDADAIDGIWREAERDGKVVKLGGGFYCGLLRPPEDGGFVPRPLYVFNAFFLRMRSKFVQPGTSVHAYVISWDPARLSWADFRARVLGPTDPARAPRGSIRRTLYGGYRKFGLEARPDRGDNGVHASASPLEGMAERANWAGVPPWKGEFGRALLERGMRRGQIEDLSSDPRVRLPGGSGKMGSVFDAVEDLDAPECLERLLEIKDLM